MTEPLPGAMIRPFIMTGGRTRSTRTDLRWETLIEALPERDRGSLTSEQRVILGCSGKPISIAELSAHLHLPLVVVNILAGDLLDANQVRVHATDPVEIELSALTKMIERVRAL
jgi:hypothetical protein